MKLLTLKGPSHLAVATQPAATSTSSPATPTSSPAAPTRRPRLPRDATVTFNNDPPELYIHMSITKIEHIHALMESLNTYAPQIEHARNRDDY
jgi:hypothetical protein